MRAQGPQAPRARVPKGKGQGQWNPKGRWVPKGQWVPKGPPWDPMDPPWDPRGPPHGIPWAPALKYIPKCDLIGILYKNTSQNAIL